MSVEKRRKKKKKKRRKKTHGQVKGGTGEVALVKELAG